MAEDDRRRAIDLLEQAPDPDRPHPGQLSILAAATAWLGFLTAGDDPQAVLRTIPELVAHAQATGQHIVLKNVALATC